jgi:translation elongation factor EF-1beta
MTQTFFVWPHGGKSVNLVGTFNHWNATPLTKQGNYFFTVQDLADGVYSYKFVVDGRWVYDISQPHEDDGSGNWNNYVEVGEKHAQKESAPAKQHQQQQQQSGKSEKQQQQQQQQQSKKEQRQQKKEQNQQQQQEGGKGKGGKQQEQQQKKKGGKPEPAPEPEPETEAAPAEEPAEAEQEQPAPAPAAEAKKEKAAPASIITLEVVGSDVDTDMSEVERFVRSIERPGLKWEGSSVKDHVFGLKKLEIICQARDDVAIEDDVLNAISANEDLVGGASILNFSC